MDSYAACQPLPSTYRDVDITRLDLNQARAPSGLFCRDQGRTGSTKGIEHDVVQIGAIPNGVGNQRDWLNGRMQVELSFCGIAPGVLRWIVPDVGAMPSEPPQFYIVDVRTSALLEHKHQLVLGPI